MKVKDCFIFAHFLVHLRNYIIKNTKIKAYIINQCFDSCTLKKHILILYIGKIKSNKGDF